MAFVYVLLGAAAMAGKIYMCKLRFEQTLIFLQSSALLLKPCMLDIALWTDGDHIIYWQTTDCHLRRAITHPFSIYIRTSSQYFTQNTMSLCRYIALCFSLTKPLTCMMLEMVTVGFRRQTSLHPKHPVNPGNQSFFYVLIFREDNHMVSVAHKPYHTSVEFPTV